MRLHKSFYGLLCCTGFIWGSIVETPGFDRVPQHVRQDTLLVLDIDDTLLVPKQMLGCDEWFCYRTQKLKEEGLDPYTAFRRALAEWEAIRHITDMEVVEDLTVSLIQELQRSHVCIMGLTTQAMTLAARTLHHLNEHAIDLGLTAPTYEDHYIRIDGVDLFYKRGVLFTSGAHKGRALFTLLYSIGYFPKHIVFVNDKASHLAEVEVEAHRHGVDFIGLRYGYSDQRKKSFDPEIAEFQFAYSSFSRLLSDAEAKAYLEKISK